MEGLTKIFISLQLLCSTVCKAQIPEPKCHYAEQQYQRLQKKQGIMHKALSKEFSYDVKYYKTHWYINPAVDSIRGSVMMVYKVTDGYFNAMEMDMDTGLHVDSVIYKGKRFYNYSFPNYGPIHFAFSNPTPKNNLDTIEIFYHGKPNTKHRGFIQDYHSGSPIIWTLSEPFYAKDWWPCKQDLDDKADAIDVYVTVPQSCKAAGNGRLVSVAPSDTFLTYHWHHAYPITPYLVGISVTNYAEFSDWLKFDANDSMPILNYVYPEDEAQWKQDFWAVKPALLNYGRLFGRYPFWKEKYGHAAFNFNGGQEHQTMSFVKHLGFGLMVHEMAHQWFGDKITCNSWQDIWLNESFATLCEYLSAENIQGKKAFNDVKHNKRSNAFNLPNQSVSVLDTTSVNRIFSSPTTYAKGSMALHMLRQIIGDSAFFKSIYEYINDSSLIYSFAQTSDLIRHFEKNTTYDIKKYFDTWIYKTGYPNYIVNYIQDASLNLVIDTKENPYDQSVEHYPIPPMSFQLWSRGKDTILYLDIDSAHKVFNFRIGIVIDSIHIDVDENILATYQVFTDDHIFSSKVFLAPNPARDYISIEIRDPEMQTAGDFIISDATGRIVSSGKYHNTSVRIISLQNFSSGTYILTVKSGDKKIVKKFVKE